MNLGNIVVLRIWLGEVRSAIPKCLEALQFHRAAANRVGEALMHNNLGVALHHTGQHHQALSHYEQALALRDPADISGRAISLIGQAQCHLRRGKVTSARAEATNALELARDAGDRQDLASALYVAALIDLHESDLQAAAAHMSEALDEATAIGARVNQAEWSSIEKDSQTLLRQGATVSSSGVTGMSR